MADEQRPQPDPRHAPLADIVTVWDPPDPAKAERDEQLRVERCATEFERLMELVPHGTPVSSLPQGVRDLILWLAGQIPFKEAE